MRSLNVQPPALRTDDTYRFRKHVRLTARGKALVERSVQSLLDGEREALGVLNTAERAMLVELLHKVLSRRRHEETG
jgi:DNA-binding MarR family transcriptional regulator